VHDRYQNYDSTTLGALVHQLCTAHYADLRIMPMLSRDRLPGNGFDLARSVSGSAR